MKIGLPIGFSTTFWFLMGLLRTLSETFKIPKPPPKKAKHSIKDIAVLIPAHNEELVIRDCINALKQSLKAKQIYVISDGSTDNTYMLAKKEGCHVIGTAPGLGKARALLHLIETYNLYEKYKLIMIVDADTKIDKKFFSIALPFFNDPKFVAVFGSPRIRWQQHWIPQLRYYFISYRERLERILQFFLVYGQTWKYTNMINVIPGFATIYRSEILKQLPIDTPGILIEDFNLGFQVHKKNLGAVGYHPTIIGWDQHPDNFKDYWHQVRRWNIGFFQTVKVNGFWPSFFWFSMAFFTLEVLITSALILLLPLIIAAKLFSFPLETIPYLMQILPIIDFNLFEIFIAIFYFDYLFTVVIAIMGRKPQMMFYGIFFFIMHYVTAIILFSSLIPGFFKSSDGRWVSPKRFTDS